MEGIAPDATCNTSNTHTAQVPAVVQTAALLGVGLLYQRSAHRLMTEVLLGEIARAPTNELLECRESYSLTAGLALGMLCLGRGSDAAGLADLRLEDQLGSYMHGRDSALPWPVRGAPRTDERPAVNRCCRIREGPLINIDVTAAGATLALGLTFLQTNNFAVAAQLRLPQSMYMLACVRPDLIALRVIARAAREEGCAVELLVLFLHLKMKKTLKNP